MFLRPIHNTTQGLAQVALICEMLKFIGAQRNTRIDWDPFLNCIPLRCVLASDSKKSLKYLINIMFHEINAMQDLASYYM
jgi:hypothetical protein